MLSFSILVTDDSDGGGQFARQRDDDETEDEDKETEEEEENEEDTGEDKEEEDEDNFCGEEENKDTFNTHQKATQSTKPTKVAPPTFARPKSSRKITPKNGGDFTNPDDFQFFE